MNRIYKVIWSRVKNVMWLFRNLLIIVEKSAEVVE